MAVADFKSYCILCITYAHTYCLLSLESCDYKYLSSLHEENKVKF